jgi:hypothetical protein
VLKYKNRYVEYGLIINNLFNVRWKETVFETETRLKRELHGVNGLSFTPGTKFDAQLNVAVLIDSNRASKKDN